jgi:lipoyl(octanoyl) transferase 2
MLRSCSRPRTFPKTLPLPLPRCRIRQGPRRWVSRLSSPGPHAASHQAASQDVQGDGSRLRRPRLQHTHLDAPSGCISYAQAVTTQAGLRKSFFAFKERERDPDRQTEPPAPQLFSFTPEPTYTLGRRQTLPSASQLARLRAPLFVLDKALDGATLEGTANGEGSGEGRHYTPEVVSSDRGGLTTYHGPGQIVLWPVLDLHSPLHRHFTVRSYARLLEETTAAVLSSVFSIQTYLNDDEPGVWVQRGGIGNGMGNAGTQDLGQGIEQEQGHGQRQDQERKIAAMGVHLRRHITGLGVAINIDVPVTGPEAVNPWARFVPCGLEGKAVTSIAAELGPAWMPDLTPEVYEDMRLMIAYGWAEEFAKRVGLAGTDVSVSMVERSDA